MDFLLDNFIYVVFVVISLISWLKTRLDNKQEEADARKAREEMMSDDSPFGEDSPWELPETRRQPSVPPPIRREASTPPPVRRGHQAPAIPLPPAPGDAALVEALVINPYEQDEVLKRQHDIQARLRQIKENKASKAKEPKGARAMRDHVLKKTARESSQGLVSIRETLRDARQSRRAIVLREVLGPPIALR